MTQSCTYLLPKSSTATYLIVLRELLIAQDLALTIADHDAAAHVIIASTAAEAVAALQLVAVVAKAFVGIPPDAFAGSDLADAIARRRGRVILLGVEAEEHGPTQGWDILAQPFMTETVMAKLADT
jgi:hypothetical protein